MPRLRSGLSRTRIPRWVFGQPSQPTTETPPTMNPFGPPHYPATAIECSAIPGVCNGGEIHSKGGNGTTTPLNNSTEADLVAAMNQKDSFEKKAIMIIQNDQEKISALLEKCAKGEGQLLTAQFLADWRTGPGGAKLWMIRKKGTSTE